MSCSAQNSDLRENYFPTNWLFWPLLHCLCSSNLVCKKEMLTPNKQQRKIPSTTFYKDDTCMHAPLCPTLCDPMDCSPPDSSVHGILQARVLDWVVILASKGSSQKPRDWTGFSCDSCIGRQILWPLRHQVNNKEKLPEPCFTKITQ